uniref:Cation/H+ exchanger domain-containing protein n=1 Tax=Acrobeloides nanus TaxID=290746 RepID=A0A914CZ13_9BILA
MFALIGTLWNTAVLGTAIYFLNTINLFEFNFSFSTALLFAALLAASDPVAVIAIFEELHINEFLYINVFGEALFNDCISLVLFSTFKSLISLQNEPVGSFTYINSVIYFIISTFGGIFVGIIFGFITSLFFK